MAEKNYLAPAEIAEYVVDTAKVKAGSPAGKLLALGFMAGMWIAMGSSGSTMIAHNLLMKPETYGLGRALLGMIFGGGLMLVVISGGELFTGNCLMIQGVIQKEITWQAMLRNWGLVYLGNLLGSLFIAALVVHTGAMSYSANDLGGMTIRIAASKTSLGFTQALASGVLCNILVCATVWMSYGAKDVAGKVLVCFFLIWLFASSGFEHCVANMYYIPAGLWAAATQPWLDAAMLSESYLTNLTWVNFALRNLVPVTLGNIIGGCGLTGCIYWYCYLRKA